VLRDDVADPSVEAHYGAAAGGGEQVQGTISAGAFGDNGRATVILDYVDGQPLLGAERNLWSNQDYRRFGSIDQRSTFSSPGNVFPAIPGTLLPGGAPFAAIVEDANRTTTLLGGLLPFELNRESLLQYFPIVAEDRRASAVATAQANVTPDLIAGADLMVVDRRVAYATAPPVVAAVVPATHPYNFVGQPVMVTALLEGVDSTQASLDSLLIRGTGSLHGKLKKWDWDLSLLRSEEDARQRIDNVVDATKLALVLANPERTLNLLAAGPAGGPEVLASVLAPPKIDNWATDGTQLTGSLGGNLLVVRAGAVSGVFGGEWRKEAVEFDSLLGSFDREVAAGFAQVQVPLLSEHMQLPAIRELTMTAAGRLDRYTDFGDIFSPQLGLVWKPLRDIGVRGTYGRSFRAPSMWQLYLPRIATTQALSDPRRNGEAYLADQLAGGNPDLEATRGRSFTAGIEFTPAALEPLALSATYWHVELDSRVTALTPSFVLLHEADAPGRVRRDEPTAADLVAGLPGRVLQVDTTFMNFGSLATSGVDAGATYAFDSAAGHFATDVKATWIDAYETRDLPATPATERVSLANAFGTIAKWRAIASVDWQRGALGATTYVRFIPSYNDTRGGVRNGRTIPSQTFLDLQLSLDLGQLIDDSALLRGLKFTAGAINAFNQEPHFAEVGAVQGYDTSQGDLKGRFWYLRLGKTF
jgi:iron complex outermembrane recepter protein